MNSPLSHEGPARRRLPAKAQRLAGLPLETSLAPLQTRLASPCKDYLCGSSNPVSKKKKRRERTTKEKNREKVAMSVSLLHIQMQIRASVLCSCYI